MCWFLKIMTVMAVAASTVFGAKALSVKSVKVERSVSCPDEYCPEDERPCPDRAIVQSGEYPQIFGFSDARFQEGVNFDIRKQAEEFLTGGGGDDANIGFTVLQNDGDTLAIQLRVGYEGSRCFGGIHWSTNDRMITIDVPNNKTTDHRFSRGGYQLYPYSAVTMSVSSINQLIAAYDSKDMDCDMSISNIKDGTFVIANGYVAVEMYLDIGCARSHADQGIHVIPLYKLVPEAPSSTVFTDRRDGKTYKSIKIGDKTWMTENLNYQTDDSWCYGNDNSNCDKYGRLYTWNSAMRACPAGWHLPSRKEWKLLVTMIGDSSVVGKKLKTRSGWKNNGNGTDNYGFSALPGGFRVYDAVDSFSNAGSYGYWWTATEKNGNLTYSRGMGYNEDNIYEGAYYGQGGLSVRCVHDEGEDISAAIDTKVSKALKNERNIFNWLIYVAIVIVVLAVIIAVIMIPNRAKKIRRIEDETDEDANKAIDAVKKIKSKFTELASTIKNAEPVSVSAKARSLVEDINARVNKLTAAVKEAVELSIKITELRSKRTLAAFEKAVAVAKQAEETVQQLEKEIDAAKNLHDQAMKEERFAKKEKIAENGDAKDKFEISRWYLNEENNFERYAYWLRKSAEQGHPAAQRQLGLWYLAGIVPMKQDVNEALVWFEKAAGHDGFPPMTKDTADWFKLFCNTEKLDFIRLVLEAINGCRTDVLGWLFGLWPDKAVVNQKDSAGLSLLHIAAEGGNIDVMRLLTDLGADVEARDKNGKTPVFALANAGHTEALKWLVKERRAVIEARDNNGRTPIFTAVRRERVEIIKCLKEDLGASILVRDSNGLSPMDYAVENGKIEAIKCLKQLGANINTKTSDGLTPIFGAVSSGKIETVKCLVNLGADINAVVDDGTTLMTMAAKFGHPEIIIYLNELGADINAGDSVGMTPIFVAAASGKPANIECLVSLGADVNTKSKNGMTPMFLAAAEGQLESVKSLIALGADVNVEAKGITPVVLAVQGGHVDVVKYLRANGAR